MDTNIETAKEWIPPTLAERLEAERNGLIKKLGECTVKIEMLKADPTLAEKIEYFNHY